MDIGLKILTISIKSALFMDKGGTKLAEQALWAQLAQHALRRLLAYLPSMVPTLSGANSNSELCSTMCLVLRTR